MGLDDLGLDKNIGTYIQGEWTQTVTSNLALTNRKKAINFNLKGFSIQGRLGIYP